MQINPAYQGPSQLSNSWTNEDQESSVAFIGAPASKQLRIIYRNSDMIHLNSTAYAGDGAHAKTFIGEVNDSVGQYAYPTFTVPKLLGDNSQADPYLIFGVNFGDDSSRFLSYRTGMVETFGVSGNIVPTEGYNYRAVGGIPYSAWSCIRNRCGCRFRFR
jgi:hypothetical protein